MSEELNYQKAMDELQEISRAIENETIPLDDLAKKVKRASELITFCRQKLRSTEDEVNKIIDGMDLPEGD
ncbi:MAG: exodeoxyribonuclease VII small subunit [Bacteroidetes bacterium]|jgi:exodeoxyribonuclease VII small subunit|nr:exodeoxyribonuclease VII small subunit [Bacteroidota bacterium]